MGLCGLHNQILYLANLSLSDTDEALKLLKLESGHSDLPRPALKDMQVISSESSAGSEWVMN
jgi:hypothetical protein